MTDEEKPPLLPKPPETYTASFPTGRADEMIARANRKPCNHVIVLIQRPNGSAPFDELLRVSNGEQPDDRFRYCPRCGERLEER